jgi:hypothetical protein
MKGGKDEARHRRNKITYLASLKLMPASSRSFLREGAVT